MIYHKPLSHTNQDTNMILETIVCDTEDGSMDAVPQILYGQYLILGVFGSYMF